jgi:hypothetical protein
MTSLVPQKQNVREYKTSRADCVAQRPDWMMVYGDVNSTVAATMVCAKGHRPAGQNDDLA